MQSIEKIIECAKKSVMDEIDMGFIIVDKTGVIIEVTEKTAYYYGSSREKLLNGLEIERLPRVPEEYCFCQNTLQTGVPLRNHAVSWKVENKHRSFVVDTMILESENKEIIGACAVIKDLTNIKSLENQIQHNDRLAMIGQIAAGAAHEIRNPITAIRGFLQLLRRSLHEKEMTKETGYTDIMLNEIDRITELINEFLLLSKPRELEVSLCKPANIINEMDPIIAAEALMRDIDIEYKLEETPLIRIDKDLMKQVFLNIIKNAIEAMNTSKGKLVIRTKYIKEEKQVVISFKDSGPGIPSYVIDKIFDPFYTTKETGTGLGLSVCQRIVSDLGGKIKVVSKGFGTTFAVYLPEAKEDS